MSDAAVHDGASLESLVAEVADEFLARQKRGERPDVEEYARRYPPFAAVLRQVLSALELVQLSSGAGPPAPGPAAGAPAAGLLGDFRVLREVGRGGMGVVYEARQLSLNRRVALKVLPFAAALDARQLQRFKKEAQAAAHLHHSNIVPVFAVGEDRGTHYYAMQFIEGRSLAEVIGDLRAQAAGAAGAAPAPDTLPVACLSTERSARRPTFFRTVARLGLQAAEALEHAHQEGVVHRDVKPANLLVDAKGNLWVTDFGLARLQNEAGLTVSGDLVGTLRYMSPEQALAYPGGVDHRTDVYSLGATLYELLTLRPAFDGRDRQELLRRIASEEPRPPRRLSPAVPAELEIIIRKALEKEAGARYATAQELADDLRRFLEDKPIRARRPSWLEQARKWARRHRPAVWSAAAASLVALAVLAGSVGWVARDRATRQGRVAADLRAALEEAERSRREGQWPRAQAAARRAEALLRDGAADPAVAERVRGLLRELAEEEADGRLVARLDEIRLLQAEVNVKEDRFVLERALPEYRRAFGDYGLRAGATAPEEAAARLRRRPAAIRGPIVGALDHWLVLARYRKAPEAGWLERALSAADSDAWRQRVRAARARGDRLALEELAREVDATAQPPEALFLLDLSLPRRDARGDAVALLRRAQAAFPGDFWINHDLGMALRCCRPPQHAEAIRFLTAAVALRPDSAGAILNLGGALSEAGRLDEAVAAYRRAIELRPDYATAHYNLGLTLGKQGRPDEAAAAHRRAIELRPDFAWAHCDLGVVLLAQGRPDEAVAAFRKAVELRPACAAYHYNLGNGLVARGRPDEAAAAFRRAIDLKDDWAEAHCNLGGALGKMGRHDEAVAAFRRAVARKPALAIAHYNLGDALAATGRLDEAVAAYRKAVEVRPEYAEAHCNLGKALGKMGRHDEEIAAYRRATEVKPDLALAHFYLGLALTERGRPGEAVTALRKAIDLKLDRAEAHYDLGNALRDTGRLDEAAAAYRRAIELRPEYAEAHCNLGDVLLQLGEFARALAAFQRGHELGARRPDWPYPSAEWVRECRRLVELDGREQAVLRGEAQPGSAAERNEYARVCYYKRLYLASARLRADAFAADPKLADDLKAGHRYGGACAAALAGCGRGAGAGRLGAAERARWRQQALAWLRADLTANGKLLEGGDPADRRLAAQRLRQWPRDPNLAALRDPAAVARLPADEQKACRQLWAEVAALLNTAGTAR
jgi:tetratricopeptide (TPR) repeat protein